MRNAYKRQGEGGGVGGSDRNRGNINDPGATLQVISRKGVDRLLPLRYSEMIDGCGLTAKLLETAQEETILVFRRVGNRKNMAAHLRRSYENLSQCLGSRM